MSKIKSIVGLKITRVRQMSQYEMDHEGWERPTTVLELEDGRTIYASQDNEGNGPGAMFGMDKEHGGFYVWEEENEQCADEEGGEAAPESTGV